MLSRLVNVKHVDKQQVGLYNSLTQKSLGQADLQVAIKTWIKLWLHGVQI